MVRPKSGKASAAKANSLSPEVASQVSTLKSEADALYQKEDFQKAVDTYTQLSKLAGGASFPQKTDVQLKKAGALMRLHKYKDAVKECTTVLDSQPGQAAALTMRAAAYELMSFYKQALADVQAVNKSKAASDATRETEARLRNIMATNKSKLSAGIASSHGAVKPKKQAAPAPPPANQQNPYFVTLKCTHGTETRLIHASLLLSYAELLDAVKGKFPSCGPCKLQYKDKEGSTVTISSRKDIQSYLAEAINAFQKANQSTPKGMTPQLPPLKIQVIPCGESEVPPPPADEVAKLAEANQGQNKQEEPATEYEFEPWLLRFAKLFSEVTSIDPAVDNGVGHDQLARAMETTLTNEKAKPLFDRAAEHFRDATCASLIQWGNVHVVKAEKHAQSVLKKGNALGKADIDLMLKEYKATEDKIKQALTFKPDSWEAIGSLGQLEWERLKAKLGYIVPNPQLMDEASAEGKSAEAQAAETQAAVSEAVKAALGKLTEKDVKGVQSHIKSANEWFDKALALAKNADAAKKKDDEETAGATPSLAAKKKPELTEEQQQQARLSSGTGNMLIMHGNVQYEWSQVQAAVGQAWKPTLDSAVEKFREAGASETEIRSALKNHSRKDELDLGPDPEPPASEQPAAAEAAVEEKSAKGLPSLPAKPAKKK